MSSIFLALVAQKSPTEKLIQNLLNNPFAGIHQLNWFDWAMLIPYFSVLIILSIYGLHRYDVIRTYFIDSLVISEDFRVPGMKAAENSALWDRRARKRRMAVDRYLWNEEKGMYFDYNTVERKQAVYESATT